MVQKEFINSAFELFVGRKKKSPSKKHLSCMQKYKNTLPTGYCHDYPNMASLKVTSDCNLRCKHCYYSGEPSIYNPEDDVSKEEICELINFLVEDLNILSLTLTGGEPFLRKDFIEIIEYAKQKGLPLAVQTNGTLLNEEDAKRLSQILHPKVDVIHISLEGADSEAHDKIRGKGTFDKTVNSVKLLRKYNLPVQINTTLTSVSAPTLENIFELCSDLDVKKLTVAKFHVCHENHKYLDLSPDEIIYCSHKLYRKMTEYPEVSASIKTVDVFDILKFAEGRALLDDYLEKNPPPSLEGECLCCHNHNKIVISAKGDIFICSTYEEAETTLGNLFETDFYEIWEKRFDNPYFQKRDITTLKCKHCKYLSLCGAGCIASAYKKYGDINMAPAECPYFDEYLRGLNE